MPYIRQVGDYKLFVSNNYGVDFLELPVPLRYHPVPITQQAKFDKI